MKTPSATNRSSESGSDMHASLGAGSSRAVREKAELAMTPAERLTLALELSDLCEELATSGRCLLLERS